MIALEWGIFISRRESSKEELLDQWNGDANRAFQERYFHDAYEYFGKVLEIAPQDERAKEGRAQAALECAKEARYFADDAYKFLQEYGSIEAILRGESLENLDTVKSRDRIKTVIGWYELILKYLPYDSEARMVIPRLYYALRLIENYERIQAAKTRSRCLAPGFC